MVKRMLSHAAAERAFDALGVPMRRAILEQLSRGPASVGELAAPLDITLAAVVQHIQVLEKSNLVRTEKVGRVRTCRLELSGLRVASQWLAERQQRWERRMDRLGRVLAETQPAARSRTKPRSRGPA